MTDEQLIAAFPETRVQRIPQGVSGLSYIEDLPYKARRREFERLAIIATCRRKKFERAREARR